MRDILQVAEAGQPGNFVRKQSHPTVTWTFAADDSSRLSTCRGNLRSSTYDRISTSRSQESEDSGVKSSVSTSQNEDDPPLSPTSTDDPPLSPTSTGSDDTKKKRSILRKMSSISGMSLRSCPSSPLFDFPSFDELFEAGGKQHMALAMHQSRSGLLRQPSYPGPTVSVLDEHTDDLELSTTPPDDDRKSFKRQDSELSQNFTTMVYRSWEKSKGFRGYRERLGNSLCHRYCMCCRCESTLFIGLYCLVGVFLTCSGIVCFINCQEELLVSSFLMVDGVLSVFVFPALVMGWTKRIGGCVGKDERVGSGSFWISVVVLRIFLSASGTFVCVHRFFVSGPVWTDEICRFEFYALLGGIVFEWIFCLFAIFLPLCFYCILYKCARSFEPKPIIELET
uniref:Uncharacterized protein LOC111128669 n=1 Tax=Crassostrea virginica TaxID=6565 RepID=A0A8B8DRF4_CRAVI|nr:uncharacterized protein LOC111128669 [Crassostrea virginica]